MELHLRVDGRGDRTRQVYQQVRAAIADGLLRPGEAVPSSRELARRLGVARNTVTLAYDRLTAEGFLRSRIGAGTYVCAEGVSPVGHLARHIRRLRGVCTARHLAVQEGLAGPLGAYLEPVPSAAGLHIAARLRAPADENADVEIVARAELRGVALQPLSMFRMAGTTTPPGLMFGYGGIDVAAIPEGLRRLGACLET